MAARRAAAVGAAAVAVQVGRFASRDRAEETHTLSTAVQQFFMFDALRVAGAYARWRHDQDCAGFEDTRAPVRLRPSRIFPRLSLRLSSPSSLPSIPPRAAAILSRCRSCRRSRARSAHRGSGAGRGAIASARAGALRSSRVVVVKVGDLRTTTSDVPRARYAAERNYTAHSWWWTGGGLCPPPCCSSALRTALRSREPTLPVRGFFGFG